MKNDINEKKKLDSEIRKNLFGMVKNRSELPFIIIIFRKYIFK